MFHLINQNRIEQVISQLILHNALIVEVVSINGLNVRRKRFAISVETTILVIVNILIEIKLRMNLKI